MISYVLFTWRDGGLDLSFIGVMMVLLIVFVISVAVISLSEPDDKDER